VVRARPFSDATLFVLILAEELRVGAQLGVNYVNLQTPEKLARRYSYFRRSFSRDGLGDEWLRIPPVRSVPRNALSALLEMVEFGQSDSKSLPEEELPEAPHGDEQEVGGSWPGPKPAPIPARPPHIPLLPEFERLWDYLDRCSNLPALLIVDSITALARHYGVEPAELVRAIQVDLVETGCASVVYVFEGEDQPAWFQIMDGILSWSPIRNAGIRPHWLLTIEYLIGRVTTPLEYVMTMENGRLVRPPSHDEIIAWLEGSLKRPLSRVPPEVLDCLREPGGDLTTILG